MAGGTVYVGAEHAQWGEWLAVGCCCGVRVECANGHCDVTGRSGERSAKNFSVFIGDSALLFPWGKKYI